MNTKIIKQAGMSVLALSVVLALGACSSKPSPWSQQASPWDNRQSSAAEAAPEEAVSAEQSPFVDDASAVESSGIAEPVAEENYAITEEPVAAEPMMEEVVAEPVMATAMMGGDIHAQAPGDFAVQLVASSSMDNLQAFVRRHQLSGEWIAETNVNGKTWFVLLQGVYRTKSEAQAALDQVNMGFNTSPWIRSVGSLQAVMTK